MATKDFLSDLNEEKQKIIKTDGNVLVVANPGTGKTKLLAYKFIYLLKQGLKPEEILCLTFTNKAKRELEDRIIELIKKQDLDTDLSKLNVHTFHSYALDFMEEDEIVSSNLLRFSIYRYLKQHEILNYSDEYLIDTIVPKMENLLRYLKSFGITPDKINLKKAKQFIEADEKLTKEELDKFAEDFVKIFEYYEKSKEKKGIDYADMLINFLNLKNHSKFKYVLVDELQDVNIIEADIALKSGDNFVAVGDKKQAIFGFQGGSTINFKKFSKATNFILSENFRSSNEILNYASEAFTSKTKDKSHKEDLKNLKNREAKPSVKPQIYETAREDTYRVVCELVKQLSKEHKKVAVIARTNSQLMTISKELKNRGIDHSSTFFSASGDAKEKIITFLKGVLSNDVQIVKNSMFTPFFPCSIQNAFDIADKKTKTLEDVYNLCPEFKKLRESVKSIQDLDLIFKERITPVSINYGREFLLASLNVQEALREAIKVIDTLDMKNIIDYLQSSNLLVDGSDVEKQVIVTTVHKSKGKEYEAVIYIPTKTRDKSNFQDRTVEAILKSENIDAKEELEEESLRIDFVAFTRAKTKLCIVTDKVEDYMNNYSEATKIQVEAIESFDLTEKSKRAYNLFVNGEYDKAKELLKNDKSWIVSYIRNHFENLPHISFSGLNDDPYEYLIYNILHIKDFSSSTNLGSEVHKIAKIMCDGDKCEVEKEYKPYKENIEKMLIEIKKQYPELAEAEQELKIPLAKLIQTDDGINFKGFIDAVFKNKDSYLIVDWKSDKKVDRASEHRQQLEAYRRGFSIKKNISIDKIKVAICFIGLRRTINLGKIECMFDDKQPAKSAFDTFTKKANKILEWKKNPEAFFTELMEKEVNDDLWRSVVEQYKTEKN
ncbi:MAG TPA: UvrD-helicase domain-containing protein [Candidatus Nanoarchaeia archaeon]|nr:UvrD-helicase domain-containing protein [Candidatus Nanoarchaeia archaeon]